nr:MAG TPA: hypothetical protein [Caudoviricetes sp.]
MMQTYVSKMDLRKHVHDNGQPAANLLIVSDEKQVQRPSPCQGVPMKPSGNGSRPTFT